MESFLGLPLGLSVDSKPYLLHIMYCQFSSPKGDCLSIEFLMKDLDKKMNNGKGACPLYLKPKELNIRIPSGNEAGANNLWIPGGKLPTGKLEAVIDAGDIPKSKYNTTIIEFNKD